MLIEAGWAAVGALAPAFGGITDEIEDVGASRRESPLISEGCR